MSITSKINRLLLTEAQQINSILIKTNFSIQSYDCQRPNDISQKISDYDGMSDCRYIRLVPDKVCIREDGNSFDEALAYVRETDCREWIQLVTINSAGSSNVYVVRKESITCLEVIYKETVSTPMSSAVLSAKHESASAGESIITQPSTGNIMTSRKLVTVSIIDPSAGIEPKDSLIASLGDHVMDSDESTLKLQLAMDPEVKLAKSMADHNAKRAEIVDLDILQRTGNEVKLRPLKIEELHWIFK